MTLAALLVWFIAPNSRGAIEGWEACCQLLLYCGYVYLMKHNSQLEEYVKAHILPKSWTEAEMERRRSRGSVQLTAKVEPDDGRPPETEEPDKDDIEAAALQVTFQQNDLSAAPTTTTFAEKRKNSLGELKEANFARPSTFRSSIVNLLLSKNKKLAGISGTAGVCVVSKVKGDVYETFRELDVDHNGNLDFGEIRQLLLRLGDPDDHTNEKVEELKELLDMNHNNTIDVHEFTQWYITSESRLKAETKMVFDEFDLDKSGTIDVMEVRQVVTMLAEGKPHLEKEIANAVDEFQKTVAHNGRDCCDYREFQTWYESTVFWTHAKAEAEEAGEAINGMWTTVLESVKLLPELGCSKDALVILLLLPLNALLALTIPDCRVPGKEKFCYATFVGSIIWIGVYSYFMVTAIEIIGCFLNVSPFIMGLIPLAAGTSPCLFVILVAKKKGKKKLNVLTCALQVPPSRICCHR